MRDGLHIRLHSTVLYSDSIIPRAVLEGQYHVGVMEAQS